MHPIKWYDKQANTISLTNLGRGKSKDISITDRDINMKFGMTILYIHFDGRFFI